MPAKKWSATQNIIWGDRTLQAGQLGNEETPAETPDTNDPEWNELVDDAILQSRITDQALLSNLEINADKRLIARYGGLGGYAFRLSPSAGGGIMQFADTEFDAALGLDRVIIRDPQGGQWVKLGIGGGIDSDFGGAQMVNPVFNKPTVALASGILGWDSVLDQYVYGSGDLIGTLVGLYSARDIVVNKFYGFQERNGVPQSIGMPAPTVILEGTGAAAADNPLTDSMFTQYTTGNASGNRAGVQSSIFNLNRRSNRPNFGCTFRTGASIADIRLWIVLTNANIGATDDPASGHLVGLRFSSTTDTQFRSVTKDGTTLQVSGFGGGITPAINTSYKLFAFWSSVASVTLGLRNYAGSIIGAKTFGTNLPGATTNLGFQATLETKTAASKVWNLSSFKVEHL